MNPECMRHRSTLWQALTLAQRVAQKLESTIEVLDERGGWLNELRRILSDVAVAFGAPAVASRLTGIQRRVMADVMRATGLSLKGEESPPQ